MRWIDADARVNDYYLDKNKELKHKKVSVIDFLLHHTDGIPEIEYNPISAKRIGTWKSVSSRDGGYQASITCSHCKKTLKGYVTKYVYCPICGSLNGKVKI